MGIKQHVMASFALLAFTNAARAADTYALTAFEGTWSCVDSVTGAYQLKSELSVQPLSAGLWKVHYKQEQNPQLDKPYESEGVWGYSALQNRYFRFITDNFQGSDAGFSQGLDQNTFVWTGESTFFGGKFEYSGTFTFTDPNTYQSVYQSRALGSQDAWQETTSSACRKSSR